MTSVLKKFLFTRYLIIVPSVYPNGALILIVRHLLISPDIFEMVIVVDHKICADFCCYISQSIFDDFPPII